jgi:hypothetical protein|eukprot:6569744-Prymnesium_polylepis.1
MGNLVQLVPATWNLVPGYQQWTSAKSDPIRLQIMVVVGSQRLLRVMLDISCAVLPQFAVRTPTWAQFGAIYGPHKDKMVKYGDLSRAQSVATTRLVAAKAV